MCHVMYPTNIIYSVEHIDLKAYYCSISKLLTFIRDHPPVVRCGKITRRPRSSQFESLVCQYTTFGRGCSHRQYTKVVEWQDIAPLHVSGKVFMEWIFCHHGSSQGNAFCVIGVSTLRRQAQPAGDAPSTNIFLTRVHLRLHNLTLFLAWDRKKSRVKTRPMYNLCKETTTW